MVMKEKSVKIPGLDLAGRDLEAVEALLGREVRSEVRLVLEVGHHILGSGGKRLRPLLTLLCGRVLGFRPGRELYAYAAAMELAHNSTLLHDDVIDEAEVRRGVRSANRVFGNAPSIIVGDYLLFKSFALCASGGRLAVIRYMSKVAVAMAEGEAYQLAQKDRVDLTLPEYERIIMAKTALLIQACCEVPAIALDAPRRQRNAVAGFGLHLGRAFQIVDDALDYAASDEKWGKQVGKDFLERKATLPLIIAFQRGTPAERKELRELFRKEPKGRADYDRVMTILDSHDAVAAALAEARRSVDTAKRKLGIFPAGPARSALAALAEFVTERTT
jgi:octaprenyl-diphosphate synthase